MILFNFRCLIHLFFLYNNHAVCFIFIKSAKLSLLQKNSIPLDDFHQVKPIQTRFSKNDCSVIQKMKKEHTNLSEETRNDQEIQIMKTTMFPELKGIIHPNELQKWMIRDLNRRRSELLVIGWLGRVFLMVPNIIRIFLPTLFIFDYYKDEADILCRKFENGNENNTREDDQIMVECVVKESTVVKRGIPIRLRLSMKTKEKIKTSDLFFTNNDDMNLKTVNIVAFGCDIIPSWPKDSQHITSNEAKSIFNQINSNMNYTKMIVRAMTDSIFDQLEPQLQYALSNNIPLLPHSSHIDETMNISNISTSSDTFLNSTQENVDDYSQVKQFIPRHDLYAREGLNEKWLQKISGYYFAKSYICDTSFSYSVCEQINRDDETKPNLDLKFTFYYDPTEPPNSIERGMNVNPEILACKFGCYIND